MGLVSEVGKRDTHEHENLNLFIHTGYDDAGAVNYGNGDGSFNNVKKESWEPLPQPVIIVSKTIYSLEWAPQF